MDEARAAAALDRLIAWGLAEETPEGEVRGTKRWHAKLQAAAEKLNRLAAEWGANPKGNPLVLAVQQALANENLAADDAEFADCVRALVTLELSRMTPEKRAQMGFEGALPDHAGA